MKVKDNQKKLVMKNSWIDGFEKITKSEIEKIRDLIDKKGRRYRVRFDYEYIEINSVNRYIEIIKLSDYYFTVLDQIRNKKTL